MIIVEWANEHQPNCPVTIERKALVEGEGKYSYNVGVLRGILTEWDAGGDEEAEHCNCGVVPTEAWLVALYGDAPCDIGRNDNEDEYGDFLGDAAHVLGVSSRFDPAEDPEFFEAYQDAARNVGGQDNMAQWLHAMRGFISGFVGETLTPQEKEVIVRLVGWALDQAHDSRGFGDPNYLFFLTDDADPDDTASAEKIEATLNSIHAKLTTKSAS